MSQSHDNRFAGRKKSHRERSPLQQKRRVSLGVEALEDRLVPAMMAFASQAFALLPPASPEVPAAVAILAPAAVAQPPAERFAMTPAFLVLASVADTAQPETRAPVQIPVTVYQPPSTSVILAPVLADTMNPVAEADNRDAGPDAPNQPVAEPATPANTDLSGSPDKADRTRPEAIGWEPMGPGEIEWVAGLGHGNPPHTPLALAGSEGTQLDPDGNPI